MSGSIRKENNGTFTFQFWHKEPQTGRRQNVKRRGYSSKRAAASALRNLQVSYEQNGPESGSKMLLKQFLEIWFERQRSGKAAATNDRYHNAVYKHIIPALGNTGITKLTLLQIENFFDEKLKAGFAEETVNGFYRVLNLALKEAVRWGYINRNPAERANAPRAKQVEKSVMPLEEQGVLVELLKNESDPSSTFYRRNGCLACSTNTLLFHIAALTGLRRGEIAALKFADVDWSNRSIAVRRALSQSAGQIIVKAPKTQRGQRHVEIDQTLITLLSQHQETMKELQSKIGDDWNRQGWLFVSINGSVLAPRALNARFARLLKRAGFSDKGYGLHTLRHTHISQLLMRNVPLLMVSRRVGHSSVATTMNLYGHLISPMSVGVVESHLREIQHAWV